MARQQETGNSIFLIYQNKIVIKINSLHVFWFVQFFFIWETVFLSYFNWFEKFAYLFLYIEKVYCQMFNKFHFISSPVLIGVKGFYAKSVLCNPSMIPFDHLCKNKNLELSSLSL